MYNYIQLIYIKNKTLFFKDTCIGHRELLNNKIDIHHKNYYREYLFKYWCDQLCYVCSNNGHNNNGHNGKNNIFKNE